MYILTHIYKNIYICSYIDIYIRDRSPRDRLPFAFIAVECPTYRSGADTFKTWNVTLTVHPADMSVAKAGSRGSEVLLHCFILYGGLLLLT